MAVQVSGFQRLAESFFQSPSEREAAKSGLSLLNILVIWHCLRLAQLKRFNLWLTIWFFGIWTLKLCVTSLVFFMHDAQDRVVPVMFFFAFNVVSLLYLGRPSFRQFAARFVAEREGP